MEITYKRLTDKELDTFISMRITQLREEGATEDIDLVPELKAYYNKHMADGTFVSWLAMDGDKVIGTSGNIEINKNTIVPIYSLCEGLNPKTLTNAINNALSKFQDKIHDPVPKDILSKLNYIDKKTAIINIHNPKTQDEIDNARNRLVFEEFFSMQLNLAILRNEISKSDSIKLEIKKGGLTDKFIKNLPFVLDRRQIFVYYMRVCARLHRFTVKMPN